MDRLRIKSVLLLIGCSHLYLLAQIACIVWLEVPVCEHDGYEVRGESWRAVVGKKDKCHPGVSILFCGLHQYCEPYFSETLSTSPVKTGCADGMVVFLWRIGLLRSVGKTSQL